MHSLYGIHVRNLYPSDDYTVVTISSVIFIVIMPIFFALSGFLFKEVETKSDYILLIKKKACSLLIPYIIFSFIYILMQHVGGNAIRNLMPWSSIFEIWYYL